MEDTGRIDAGPTISIGEIGAIAEQPTSPGELASFMTSRYTIATSKLGNLLCVAIKDWADANNERARLQFNSSRKGCFDFLKRASLKHFNLDSKQRFGLFRVADDRFRSCDAWIDQ